MGGEAEVHLGPKKDFSIKKTQADRVLGKTVPSAGKKAEIWPAVLSQITGFRLNFFLARPRMCASYQPGHI